MPCLRSTLPRLCASNVRSWFSWWRGHGNALDEIGATHGTLAGDAAYGAGRVGQGFAFDGNETCAKLGNPTNLQTQNFTIEA